MTRKRPYILTLAGFDPSSGAGLTADIKTIERLKCYGFAVQTANTIQTDTDFFECHWIDSKTILSQLDALLNRFTIAVVKVGIVKDWKLLLTCIEHIKTHSENTKIILDPVLKSSTHFDFRQSDAMSFDALLEHLYLLTPNHQELQMLYDNQLASECIVHLTKKTNVLVTGGHRTDKVGQDVLYTTTGKRFAINAKNTRCSEKHGSGCVLSTAIATYTALGFPLLKSCVKAKKYVEKFLSSNTSLLGYHQ